MKTKRSRTATTNPFGKLDPLPIGGDVRRRLQSRPYFRTPPFFVKAKKETGVSGFCSFSSSSSTVSTAGFIVAMDVLRLGVCFSVPPSLLLREVLCHVCSRTWWQRP
ncbi:PREDICTED: uncharacterized protein LOC109124853 isoform X4 [Camelina sativa]|uniref:Uncharacterized protein LOC109124853 isoform X4 n=1 Tax=Camelina sativa TaxID=90675 RepID=A0ABM1QK45_CAMSA|nr:PREDICTED: uncharacterized protein LOC109124853 isoform X4 [Camelina sativa]